MGGNAANHHLGRCHLNVAIHHRLKILHAEDAHSTQLFEAMISFLHNTCAAGASSLIVLPTRLTRDSSIGVLLLVLIVVVIVARVVIARECSGVVKRPTRSGTLTVTPVQYELTRFFERGAAARKSQRVTRITGVEKFVGSRFTPTCNTSSHPRATRHPRATTSPQQPARDGRRLEARTGRSERV